MRMGYIEFVWIIFFGEVEALIHVPQAFGFSKVWTYGTCDASRQMFWMCPIHETAMPQVLDLISFRLWDLIS